MTANTDRHVAQARHGVWLSPKGRGSDSRWDTDDPVDITPGEAASNRLLSLCLGGPRVAHNSQKQGGYPQAWDGGDPESSSPGVVTGRSDVW